jgi:restriction system protein
MPRRKESLFGLLTDSPWWMSVVVACIVFVVLRFIIPAMMKRSPLLGPAEQQISSYAVWVSLFFLVPGGISAALAWKRGELLKGTTSLSAIRNLSWRGLEELVGEAYRRNGFSVIGNSEPGADGGIDLIARKDGEKVLIQCKQWKARKIGVGVVREMFGLLNSEGANEVHIVTSGHFTGDAIDFARNKPIRLVDGSKLVQLIRMAQSARCKKAEAQASEAK